MVVNILGPNGGSTNYNTTIGSSVLNGREPDTSYNQVGILNKINFPTGGYSEFTYETNQYYDINTSQVKFGGGLRIKQIKSVDPITGVANYKTYKYGVNESGYGEIVIPISYGFFSTEQMTYYKFDIQVPSRRVRNFCSNPNIGLEPFDGNSVGYTEVTEYNGTFTSNSGKSVYRYTFQQDAFTSLYYFNKPVVQSLFFKRGQLLGKTDFKQTTPGNYQRVRSVGNSYGAFQDLYVDTKNLQVFEKNVFIYQQKENNSLCFYPLQIQPYFYNAYSILTGDNRLTASVDTLFDQADIMKYLVTKTDYSYGNFVHQQVTKKSTTNSKNEIVETVFRYPDDSLSRTVYSRMSAANIKNAVLDEEVFLNSSSIKKQHTDYNETVTNHFYPAFISTKLKTNPAVTEISFDSYDAQGNILQYTAHDSIASSFIWDYLKTYPIAKVEGARQSEIAYTSFEGDDKGNWTYTGVPDIDPSTPSGRNYLTISSNLTKSGLYTTKTYIVSYWKKSGTVTVNTTTGNPGRSVNGWTYYEHKVTNPSGGTITVSGNGAVIDELRLYPFGAQMSTFAYDPLIGLTAQCDANNQTKYFEYDAFNRLILVRDQDRNIIKQANYNYAGQQENPNIVYNQQKAAVFTTSCNTGYFGTSFSYVVPANTFSAVNQVAADQLAMDFVNANGQDYANRKGTCTAGITINGYNAKGYNYNVKFTNNSTSEYFTFVLTANTTQLTYKGVVPPGTYSVQFYPQSSPVTATFVINGLTYSGSTQTTFTNVVINNTSSAYMY
jgi:hypothetical protein